MREIARRDSAGCSNQAMQAPTTWGRLRLWVLTQAMGLAGAAGLNALNTQYNPASFNVNQLQTGSFTQPGAASAYMNPYMQNVVDIQKARSPNRS
jgi:hypothetical protein